MIQGAYLYVVGFSNGVVKIGHSYDVPQRVKQHASDAARFLVSVTGYWGSAYLGDNAQDAERALIRALRDYTIGSRREYLLCAFEKAVELAEVVAEKHGADGRGRLVDAPDYDGVGARIREAIDAAGLNLDEVKAAARVSEGQIRLYESGHWIPSPSTVSDLAEALNVSTSWILDGSGEGPVHGFNVRQQTKPVEVRS